MAQRVNVVLVDDLDGNDADETVSFGLDGTEYEIDLTEDNAQELRETLSRYIDVARKVGGRSGGRSGGRRGGGRGRRVASGGDAGPSASEIRQWARENGWDVPERGRVSAEVREAYAAAH